LWVVVWSWGVIREGNGLRLGDSGTDTQSAIRSGCGGLGLEMQTWIVAGAVAGLRASSGSLELRVAFAGRYLSFGLLAVARLQHQPPQLGPPATLHRPTILTGLP